MLREWPKSRQLLLSFHIEKQEICEDSTRQKKNSGLGVHCEESKQRFGLGSKLAKTVTSLFIQASGPCIL